MSDLKTVTVTWDENDRPVLTVTYGGADGDGGGIKADPDEWLAALTARLTDKSAEFLAALIKVNEAREFVSFDDLAAEAGVERKAIDGWNRNLGRSVKAVVRELGFLRTDQDDGTQQLFDYEWDDPNNVWKYAVPTKYRATLKEALAAR